MCVGGCFGTLGTGGLLNLVSGVGSTGGALTTLVGGAAAALLAAGVPASAARCLGLLSEATEAPELGILLLDTCVLAASWKIAIIFAMISGSGIIASMVISSTALTVSVLGCVSSREDTGAVCGGGVGACSSSS